MIENVFAELSVIIILAVIISGLMKFLRQPLIIGYIITGVLAGPFFLNIVRSTDMVATFSQFGVVFLLFIAGLSLNPKVLKSVGRVSFVTGIGQVVFTTILGFFIAKLFGFSDIVALYVSIALTFSSTIIIVKLLSDKGDLQTLYGRIAMGFLIVQDVIAILILMAVSSPAAGFNMMTIALETVLIGAGVLAAIALFSFFALPRIIKVVAKSEEFLLLFSVGWLLLMAVIFGYLNFSIEIGALLAGISLSVSPYHYEIKLKMNVLRDFFILFFFVLLGSQMVFIDISKFMLPVVVFSIFILIGNPLIVIMLMGLLKYTKRNGFMAGLTVAQISEFSFILVAVGVRMGHIPLEILSMVTTIGLVTIFGSTYMITHSGKIYPHLSGYLDIFERRGKKVDEHVYHKGRHYPILLFGYDRIAFSLIASIKKLGKKFLVVDYDPEKIADLAKEGYECRYGDVNNIEFLNELNFSKAKMIISTIPDAEANLLLIKRVRESNKNAIIITVSHQTEEAMKLYESGATYVLMPYFLGGECASTLIEKHGMKLNEFLKEKAMHMDHLKIRGELKHEHPKSERHR